MEGTAALPKNVKDERCWREFKPGNWCTTIDVRDFIVCNVTPYLGDEKFLAAPSERTKAEKPLADARVEVLENEENPGFYTARFFLRPHYQLEGMDIGMSLVSRLPGKGS